VLVPPRSPGRDRDPRGLPARVARRRDLRPALGPVDFNRAVLHVRRVKNGTPSTHPLHGDELRALRRLQRESETSPFVFVSERGSPLATAGFARMVERAAASAGLELKAHPHMLRHACGYALANKGHDTRAIQGWLGHRSITSTAVYVGAEPVQGLLAGLMRNRRGPKCGCRRHETNVEARAELFVGFSDDRGLDVVV
jgi:integrase